MMKLLYFCEQYNPFSKKKSGIEKKVYSQIQCFEEFMDVDIRYAPVPGGIVDRILFFLPMINSKRENNWKNALLKNVDVYKEIDYMYIRKPSLSIYFYSLLKKIKRSNPNIVIMMEIPTYPNTNEYHGLGKLMVLKSVNCEKKLKNVLDYILTYSRDEKIWGIPCINIANCVDYNSIQPRMDYCPKKQELRMTFVADFMYWHGADRIIKGILNYHGDYGITLNIVGKGTEIPELQKLADNDTRIVFHGFKNNEEMNDIFNNTDIAIDSLGRHRSGIEYNSTLKGKEYAARGIPVISAVKTEFDYMPEYPYYFKVPADDSDICIEDIISFHENIISNKDYSAITDEIRSITYKLFDFEWGFKQIIIGSVIK